MQQKLRALASEPRIKLIKELLKKEEFVCICELEDVLDKDRSVMYRHIKKIEEAELIKTKKTGKKVKCKLKNPNKIKKLFKLLKEV